MISNELVIRFNQHNTVSTYEDEIVGLKEKLQQTNVKLRTETKTRTNLQTSVTKLEGELREFKQRMVDLLGKCKI